MYKVKRNGFTLIEIICVIALLGIITAIAVPSIRGIMNRSNLDIACKCLVNDLRYAKMYAISRNITNVYVRFNGDISSGKYCSYTIYYSNNMANAILKEVSLPPNIEYDEKVSTYQGNQLATRIEFHSSGDVNPAGTIILRDTSSGATKKITLTIAYTRIMEDN